MLFVGPGGGWRVSDQLTIGFWFGRRGQKLHLVESVIEDRAVMRCGRQMHFRATSRGELVAGGAALRCAQCDNERRA